MEIRRFLEKQAANGSAPETEPTTFEAWAATLDSGDGEPYVYCRDLERTTLFELL